MTHIALVRDVSPSIARCALTHLERRPIDLDRARAQHRTYVQALARLGCRVEWLPPAPDLPDAVFVEDAAVVVDEIAVVARSGQPSRRPETESVAAALARHRPLARVRAPATLDGGDVLRVGRTVYVGATARSSAEGADSLAEALAPHGYRVRRVPVTGCLHLKSACTRVAERLLVVNRRWVDAAAFTDVELVDVHPDEPWGANHLLLAGAVLSPSSAPRTAERLARRGVTVEMIDLSELAKAEGGLTCSSVVFAHAPSAEEPTTGSEPVDRTRARR
jgi:dimethylargininase